MKASTILFTAIFVLAAVAGAYWYHAEGASLIELIRQSENKPFFFK